ncbi:MAG: hypothetical protein ACR2QV_17040 [Gammaproteobacteria bacterium]
MTVNVQFRALRDGRDLTTVVRLRQEPSLAAWLVSFADNRLAQLGRPGFSAGISPPPGGEVRQSLIDGGVIGVEQQPGGGTAMSLNPDQNVWLDVKVRVRGEPARMTSVSIFDDPELSRWLLFQCLDREKFPVADFTPAAETTARLCEIGVLVEESPPAEAYFPDPAEACDLVAALAAADACFVQPPGTDIPPMVRPMLGRQLPQLPAEVALIWGRDAGTGMVFPSICPPDVDATTAERLAGTDAAAREADWRGQRTAARASLRARRYTELRGIIPVAQQRMLRAYVRTLVERGYFPALDDGQVELRAAIHNEPTIASLHHGLAELLSDIAGEKLLASYCYLSHYVGGAVLERHLDRPQCAYNLSVVFDMSGAAPEPEPWPIYLELDGKAVAVNLRVGDGLMYSGTEIPHWRDALPADQTAVVCFFHFVPVDFDGALH